MTGYEQAEGNVLVERDGAVALATLNRPPALDAPNTALLGELANMLDVTGCPDKSSRLHAYADYFFVRAKKLTAT